MNPFDLEKIRARLGDGFVYVLDVAGFDDPFYGLADRRPLDQIEPDDGGAIMFSGITVEGEHTNDGKPVHVGARRVELNGSAYVLGYDDKFSGIPDPDGEPPSPRDRPNRGGDAPKPMGGLGQLGRRS